MSTYPLVVANILTIILTQIMAAHQRTLEKTKEAMRKQVECASGGFSSGSTTPSGNGYGGGDFGGHNTPAASANDYCIIAEFGDGQKWHPYQVSSGFVFVIRKLRR